MELDLERRVALVTGGGNGIGAAICARLAHEGAAVAVVDIDGDKARAQAETLRQQGHVAQGYAADITDEDAVRALVAQVVADLGRLDILVNNAGFTRDMRIGKMGLKDWRAVIDVILTGAFLCCREAMPHLAESGSGRVVNISSRAHMGNPGQVNYSAAKAGILGFTRALALESGRNGITVNAVAPGIIDTAAVRDLPHYDKIAEAARKITPIARMGEVDDVADAVAFLASSRAGYITGEVVHVTGGRY